MIKLDKNTMNILPSDMWYVISDNIFNKKDWKAFISTCKDFNKLNVGNKKNYFAENFFDKNGDFAVLTALLLNSHHIIPKK